jgi:valyl-tRNA synthetase
VSAFPKADRALFDDEATTEMATLIEIVKTIRNMRQELGIQPGQRMNVAVIGSDGVCDAMVQELPGVKFTARAEIEVMARTTDRAKEIAAQRLVTARVGDRCILVFLDADVDHELTRLQKEIQEIDKEIVRAEQKLANADFVQKARPDLVVKEKEKLESWTVRRRDVKARMEALVKG